MTTIPATGSSPPPPPPPPGPRVQFQYEAQTHDGRAIRGTVEADSVAAAQEQLAAMNLRVLSVAAISAAALRRGPMGPDDFLLFNQQLAHLTQAGLPVERGLRLIAADFQSGRFAAAANSVAAELEGGASLHDAFARHASRFPPLYALLINAGVQSGNLPAMLFNFGRHIELTGRLRRTLWRTLSYPAGVLIALALVMLFISRRIIPVFQDVIYGFEKDFHTLVSVPWLTQGLFWIGPKIPYVLAAIGVIVLGIMVAAAILRLRGRGDVIVDTFILPLPLIGPIIRRSLLARWCDALRVGVDAGLDLPRAMDLASQAVGSTRLMRESRQLTEALASGIEALSFGGHFIPPAIPAAIDFGSRTGDLSPALASLARMYEQQADQRLRSLPSILTPILLAVIAIMVGLTICAMFMPLIRLLNSMTGGVS